MNDNERLEYIAADMFTMAVIRYKLFHDDHHEITMPDTYPLSWVHAEAEFSDVAEYLTEHYAEVMSTCGIPLTTVPDVTAQRKSGQWPSLYLSSTPSFYTDGMHATVLSNWGTIRAADQKHIDETLDRVCDMSTEPWYARKKKYVEEKIKNMTFPKERTNVITLMDNAFSTRKQIPVVDKFGNHWRLSSNDDEKRGTIPSVLDSITFVKKLNDSLNENQFNVDAIMDSINLCLHNIWDYLDPWNENSSTFSITEKLESIHIPFSIAVNEELYAINDADDVSPVISELNDLMSTLDDIDKGISDLKAFPNTLEQSIRSSVDDKRTWVRESLAMLAPDGLTNLNIGDLLDDVQNHAASMMTDAVRIRSLMKSWRIVSSGFNTDLHDSMTELETAVNIIRKQQVHDRVQ
jgi:hypothetical protein